MAKTKATFTERSSAPKKAHQQQPKSGSMNMVLRLLVSICTSVSALPSVPPQPKKRVKNVSIRFINLDPESSSNEDGNKEKCVKNQLAKYNLGCRELDSIINCMEDLKRELQQMRHDLLAMQRELRWKP